MKKRTVTTNKRTLTFSERVLKAALSIPAGKVTTYGAIARAAGGGVLGARSVTAVLERAWQKGERAIPWHRVVYADGRIWISPKYRAERMRLYEKEGIEIDQKGRIRDFRDRLFEFD